MSVVYEIRDWKKHYTVAQNRRGEKKKEEGDNITPLTWVAMRTKHDGKGFRRVMRLADRMALMGAWMLIVEVAAKCPTHGKLEDADGPLTAVDLADKTGGDATVFERALQVFSSQDIGWLDAEEVAQRSERGVRTGRNGTERNDTKQGTPNGVLFAEPPADDSPTTIEAVDSPTEFEFPTRGKKRSYTLPASKLAQYRDSFPGLAIEVELRKAVQWCRDNESKQKTERGMPAFLGRWLGRACDKGGASPGVTRAPPHDPKSGGAFGWMETEL